MPDSRRAEALTASLLVLAGLAGIGFVAAYLVTDSTPWLGATLGAALGLLGAALIVAGRAVVPQEIVIEPRRPVEHPQEQRATAELLGLAGRGVSRRRLLGRPPPLPPPASEPARSPPPLARTLGRRPLDPLAVAPRAGPGRGERPPVRADELEVGSFLTAFAGGADMTRLGAPVVVVRVDPANSNCRPTAAAGRRTGMLAFSKICTHAGCAVACFATRCSPPRSPGPALVCPCHYSTFDVPTGGTRALRPRRAAAAAAAAARSPATAARAPAGRCPGEVGPAWCGVSARMSATAAHAAAAAAVDQRTGAGPRSARRCCATSSPTTGPSCFGEIALYSLPRPGRDRAST